MTFLKFDPMRHFDDIASKFETALNQACDELKDGKWKLSFAKQYDQVKWSLPENIELKNVKSVSFKVADQKGSVKKKDTDIPDCERDHYDSVRDHHAVSCIKYISNIFK